MKQLTGNLYSIQSFKNIPKATISSLKKFKNYLMKQEKYQEYRTSKGFEETEEDELPSNHEFGTLFSEDELYGVLSISIIKLINNSTEKKVPNHFTQL